MRVAGVVLAGGRSSRFGRDKAMADLGGRPLITWSLDALRGAGGLLAVNGPSSLAQMLDLPCAPDPDGAPPGPLAGVLTGLAWAAAAGCTHLLTAPCDTPFLPADYADRLKAAILERPAVAARAERIHALCALWRVETAARLLPLASTPRQPSLQAIIETLGGGWVDFDDEAAFANLNTPQDLALAEARLSLARP